MQIQVVSTDDTSIKDILENEESFKLIASTSYITVCNCIIAYFVVFGFTLTKTHTVGTQRHI